MWRQGQEAGKEETYGALPEYLGVEEMWVGGGCSAFCIHEVETSSGGVLAWSPHARPCTMKETEMS